MANIFLKTCPECAGTSSVAASACSCGYAFLSQAGPPVISQEDMVREEALYEEYLSMRAQQALEAASVARHLADLFPYDREKGQESTKLQVAAEAAQAELLSQRARVAEMIEALKDGTDSRACAAA